MGLFIQGDIIRKPIGGAAPFVDIDQGIYVPVVKQFIRGNVVMRGVKAQVFYGKPGSLPAKRVNGKKEADAVMAFCAGEIQQQGDFQRELIITADKHIEGTPKIPVFFMAVPSHEASGSE